MTRESIRHTALAAACVGILFGAGCTSVPRATNELEAARDVYRHAAENPQVQARAPVELELAERALVLSRDRKERGNQAWALRLLGGIALHSAPPAVALAETHYRHALALADELGMRPLVAHCHAGLGTLYTTTGRREWAHTELAAAIALYRAMEMTFWLTQTEATLAQVL